ncbi:MAG: calcineurin-like phosphoesterase C-terminal domain-containing protein, partial [Acidobacteria bacterium]|nr:calcineurin-like phosphoesterase C-terminal domain-containing protein [Acidobacteriota bacterium]
LGNHDVDRGAATDELSAVTYRRHFGPAWYSFELGEIHCVALDTVFWYGSSYIGYLTQDQLDWLRRDLALVEPGRTVAAFMHIPPYNLRQERFTGVRSTNTIHITNRQALYDLLAPYRAYILCGHMHECEFLKDGGANIHILGAACGAWWTGPVCVDGAPRGYAVYETRGAELRWRYVDSTAADDRQLRLYPPGAVAAFPAELAANVWAADNAWKIDWYENGVRRGPMVRRRSEDPLAAGLYRGEALPARRTWVEPVTTDHMYFARPAADAREIVVEATDPWGRVSTERLVLADSQVATPAGPSR